jgi:hypothetical protein
MRTPIESLLISIRNAIENDLVGAAHSIRILIGWRPQFHYNPYCFRLEIKQKMLWRRRPTLHYKCVRTGCPNSIKILIDFYLKFNRKCFGRECPHPIRILID